MNKKSVVVHFSVTRGRVQNAISESFGSLANPGFCLSCGEKSNECEPDAEGYKCHKCGENKVMGAEMCLMMGAYRG
jgi:predicted RNA-binding Zn-ribbon protein involved in translation (DUF1610 family)